MMCINTANASIPENIVAGKQKVPESKCQLTDGMTRSMPDLDLQLAKFQRCSLIDLFVDHEVRHVDGNSLRGDFCKRRNAIVRLENDFCVGMSDEL